MTRALKLAWVFLSACVLIIIIGVGDEGSEALALKYLGFRPIHWHAGLLNALWYFGVVPLYLVAAGFTTWLLVREPVPDPDARRLQQALRRLRAGHAAEAPRSSAAGLFLVGTPVVALCGWFFVTAVAPLVRRGTQRDSWPVALELASFDVCAIETRDGFPNRTLAHGRLAFEMVNQSSRQLREATFTVEGGPGYQYSVASLAPGEARRVEIETDLGPLWCGRSGTGRCRFRLLWDRVRFEGDPYVAVRATPPETLTSIGDCPRFDVRGVWKGTDGSLLKLNQAGTRVTGDLTGGPFTSFGGVVGQATDGRVTGTVLSRAGPFLSEGTFSLTSAPGGALHGTWAFTKGKRAGETGAWTLTRVEDPAR